MRLCFCYVCRTLTKIEDFVDRDGKPGMNPEHDVLLQDWIDRHMHGRTLDDHPGGRVFQYDIQQENLSNVDGVPVSVDPRFTQRGAESIERHAIEEVREELAKNHIEMQDFRDELKDDAGKCHRDHGQPSWPGKPCIDYHADSKRLGSKRMPSSWQKWVCTYCLGGETMVVTRTGVFRIDELARRGEAELLVVSSAGHPQASWKKVPVRSYGRQQLCTIEMVRGRQRKTVRATMEHRWSVRGKTLTTVDLRHGMILDRASAAPLHVTGERPSAVGVMHGFTYGDGTAGAGNRPAYVTIYDNGKDKALMPYFAGCRTTPFDNGKSTGANIVDLPKSWKSGPNFNESRSYLLGFLAGYFAADGHVSKNGQATIYSSVRENIEMVRTLCNLLGVQTSPVLTKQRNGFGKVSALYSTLLRTSDLPGDFWIIESHAANVTATSDRNRNWVVESVTYDASSSAEEVFCADVGGSERFVLDDNLVTLNCPYESTLTTEKRWRRGDYRR